MRFVRQYESWNMLGKSAITMAETISHQRRWAALRDAALTCEKVVLDILFALLGDQPGRTEGKHQEQREKTTMSISPGLTNCVV